MNTIKTISLSLFFVLLLSVAFAADNNDEVYIQFYKKTVSKLLPGFRYPTKNDLQNYWKMHDSYIYKTQDDERKNKSPFWTKGYFNDDNIIDYAYILINDKDNKKYMYAFVSFNGTYKPILLQDAHTDEMGLATQVAGKITTASGKGYWKSTKEDPPEVIVKRHAIAFFTFESASSIFVWNSEANKFIRHWTSD